MTTLYHNDTPYRTSGSCVLIPGLGSVPVANPPPGVYPDGGRDTPPEGYRYAGERRIIRDGKSVLTWTALEPVSLAQSQASALARFRSEAAAVIATHVPAPWDSLRDLATVEYRAWVDAFREAVAMELARLEAAVEAASTTEELAAVVPDWPEVGA